MLSAGNMNPRPSATRSALMGCLGSYGQFDVDLNKQIDFERMVA